MEIIFRIKNYFFEIIDPFNPLFKTIGNARVIGVVINESSAPELLVQPQDEEPAFYHIDELIYLPALSLVS